ncbi:unnamed protein product [Toxocara canis]|uniref:Secreted protein n=1 Tax=Toxocara canis TaxID=6265 RepID=A0A183TZ76_TOXCA|nr:unnamed protein product [Toxocara canis]
MLVRASISCFRYATAPSPKSIDRTRTNGRASPVIDTVRSSAEASHVFAVGYEEKPACESGKMKTVSSRYFGVMHSSEKCAVLKRSIMAV